MVSGEARISVAGTACSLGGMERSGCNQHPMCAAWGLLLCGGPLQNLAIKLFHRYSCSLAPFITCRCAPPAAVVAASRPVAAAAQPRQRLAWRWGGGSSSSSSSANSAVPSSGLRWQLQQHSKPHLLPPLLAAADSSGPEGGPAGDAAADELPLWRFLRQQGFSADSLSRMQAATRMSKNGRRYASVSGRQMAEEKVQRDLAPNIAALQSEGRDTASMERIFEQFPLLLTTTHKTFASALAALQRLAALLPGDPRAVQAPPGATQLGVVLWLYPTTSALLLRRANLGSLIDGNLRLRRRLGISDADTAAGLFKHYAALVTNFERAEAMVAHLQRLQASGALSAEHGEQECWAGSCEAICCSACCGRHSSRRTPHLHALSSLLCSGWSGADGSAQVDPS